MSTAIGNWPKKITVDKRIITILSGSTYNNFPKALKEIITNSYDADASEVKISVDVKGETITVEDNGHGMSESDFDFYLRIAGKTRSTREFTLSGRKRIGQFGVGFLSVFPFCRTYNIESTKKGSAEIIFASIPNHKFIEEDQKSLTDIEEIPIQGGKRIDNSQMNKQFTKIKLVGFTRLAKDFFKHAYQVSRRRETILNFPPIDRLRWELCEDLPIDFDSHSELSEKFSYKSNLPFRVYLDSNEKHLLRNVHAKNILETHKGEFETIGKIKFKYFIATDYKPVKPVEARHLKMRNFNVGVGARTTFGVGLEGRTYARLAHITGEVHFVDGMNDLINVARDNFNFSPDYEELQEFFRGRLRKWSDELDKINQDEKFISASEDKKHIKDLSALVKSNVTKKISDLEKRGFTISKSKSSSNSSIASIQINKNKKEVIVSKDIDLEESSKTIEINNKIFKIKLDNWDISEEYPACKVKERTITINEGYPLFKNKKFLDVFVKLHSLLLLNVEDGIISKKSYKSILEDIDNTFIDYKY
jgi:predicted nuclease of predicted toxin-antitoxin system